LFVKYCSNWAAFYLDWADLSNGNRHKIINCSFEDLSGRLNWAATICYYRGENIYNVTNCFFRNISNTVRNDYPAGAFSYNMNNNNDYNLSGNTFIEIKTNKSVIVFSGNSLSLIFSDNSFYNVSSVNEGGVFYIY
jgi:hypothetical protein